MKEKLYIKFKEGDQQDLDRACKIAKRLGYKKLDNPQALFFERQWILKLMEDWTYMTSLLWEINCQRQWYKEYKDQFIPWEQVRYSDKSIELAMEISSYVKYYIWKTRHWKYILENEEGIISIVKFIAKIPQPKLIKISTTDWQTIEIEEAKAKDLWFNIK